MAVIDTYTSFLDEYLSIHQLVTIDYLYKSIFHRLGQFAIIFTKDVFCQFFIPLSTWNLSDFLTNVRKLGQLAGRLLRQLRASTILR